MSNINDVWMLWDSHHPSHRVAHVTTLEQRSSRFTSALPTLEEPSPTPLPLSSPQRNGDALRDAARRAWQSPLVSRKRSNDIVAPRAAKHRPTRKECDGAALPKYVPSNLRKLLRKKCANRRGYREWSDVTRMCTDKALFHEVESSEWNARAHMLCSSAINAYRNKVLHLPRLKTRNRRKRDCMKTLPAPHQHSLAHTKRTLPALPAARRHRERTTLRNPRESERVRALANALNNPTLLQALHIIRKPLGDVPGRST